MRISDPLWLVCPGRSSGRAVVLCTPKNVVEGFLVVYGHFIELGKRQVFDISPCFGQVEAFVDPCVCTYEQVIRIIGPEGDSVIV